jgi:hypothetical protein
MPVATTPPSITIASPSAVIFIGTVADTHQIHRNLRDFRRPMCPRASPLACGRRRWQRHL